jgi:hypothetical protein
MFTPMVTKKAFGNFSKGLFIFGEYLRYVYTMHCTYDTDISVKFSSLPVRFTYIPVKLSSLVRGFCTYEYVY